MCRVAEEVIFGEENVTTGASNDFMQVSRVARQMVERFGFSKKIGQVAIGGPGGNPFLGQQVMFFNLVITNSCHNGFPLDLELEKSKRESPPIFFN